MNTKKIRVMEKKWSDESISYWRNEFQVKILPNYLDNLEKYRCFYCGNFTYNLSDHEQMTGVRPNSKYERTIDHVVPISRGGSDEDCNKVISCKSCNSKKGNRKCLKVSGRSFHFQF